MTDEDHASAVRDARDALNAALREAVDAGLMAEVRVDSLNAASGRRPAVAACLMRRLGQGER